MKCRWSVTPGGEGDYCASLPVFEHRELQNLACARSRRSPAPLRAARAAAAGFTRNCFGSRPTRTAGQRRGSGRRLPRPGAAAGPLLPPPPPPREAGAAWLAAARGPGEGAAAAGGGAAAAPQDGRQSRLLRGRCGRRRVAPGRARAGPRSVLPPADGAARGPGGRLSPPPPSALKRRGAGAIRSRVCQGKWPPLRAGRREPGWARRSPGFPQGEGAEAAPARPVLPFPSPGMFLSPASPVVFGRGLGEAGGGWGVSPGSRQALGGPRRRRINGSGLPADPPEGMPWSACRGGSGSASQP